MGLSGIPLAVVREILMTDSKQYKRFVAQFNVAEWKLLCKHRLFLHFLRTDLKLAACIAADALDRTINYIFPPSKVLKAKGSARRTPAARAASAWFRRQRRFRF